MRYWKAKYHQFRDFLHRQSMPGFNLIPIAIILKFVWKEILRDDIMTRSNSMAFSFFLSIFPSILVVLTLVPYLPVDNLVTALEHSYVDLLPSKMATYMDSIINGIKTKSQRGLLSLSLLLAIYFASSGVGTMIKGFHKSYEMTYKKTNLLERQWKALKLTVLLGLLLLGSLLAIIIGKPLLIKILNTLHLNKTMVGYYSYIRWLGVFIFYYMCISIIYRVGPAFKNKLKWFTPGATLATILSVITSFGFAIYVDNFARYNEIYGSIGALILILLWLQINSFIILIGYELNASIAINRDLLAQVEEN
jgi:membrane protein